MVDVPREILKSGKDLFALEVRGNSMVDAMIADSDIVVMERADDVRNEDVAACWLEKEQEVTLKKVYFEKDKVNLQPCNPYMLPMYHDAANVRIQEKRGKSGGGTAYEAEVNLPFISSSTPRIPS